VDDATKKNALAVLPHGPTSTRVLNHPTLDNPATIS